MRDHFVEAACHFCFAAALATLDGSEFDDGGLGVEERGAIDEHIIHVQFIGGMVFEQKKGQRHPGDVDNMFGAATNHFALEKGDLWTVDGISTVDVIDREGAIDDLIASNIRVRDILETLPYYIV